ncbi:MAG: hypothetical protein II773_08455 [Oscillospiraceae bacterium]|nr:hypothetical protein [Oscillospiraceae bacterium]
MDEQSFTASADYYNAETMPVTESITGSTEGIPESYFSGTILSGTERTVSDSVSSASEDTSVTVSAVICSIAAVSDTVTSDTGCQTAVCGMYDVSYCGISDTP